MTFIDRHEAGRRRADAPLGSRSEDPIVLGLPRGGVPVAAEVANALPVEIATPADPRFDVDVVAGSDHLPGILAGSERPVGVVVFAHCSGSSRLSPPNLAIAEALNRRGFATLLFDLLTPEEERDRANVFDIDLLARRLIGATHWLRERSGVGHFPTAYFGASTGAAAALWAAADLPQEIAAVVSRGGRPDLAAPRLAEVTAPTLLIVGGHDEVILELNREAARQLRCVTRVAVVPGATHLFEEPGALNQVAEVALHWFGRFARSGFEYAPRFHETLHLATT